MRGEAPQSPGVRAFKDTTKKKFHIPFASRKDIFLPPPHIPLFGHCVYLEIRLPRVVIIDKNPAAAEEEKTRARAREKILVLSLVLLISRASCNKSASGNGTSVGRDFVALPSSPPSLFRSPTPPRARSRRSPSCILLCLPPAAARRPTFPPATPLPSGAPARSHATSQTGRLALSRL